MSAECQQLIQEDPYVFTDTISSSTNFIQQNNSQAKYVPFNRQTIYSRQFRQHEPSIESLECYSTNGIHHQKPPLTGHKVTLNTSPVNYKNGHTKGFVSTTLKSQRTSPNSFKNHQPATDGQYLVNKNDKSTHHSVIVQPDPSNFLQKQQQQQKFSTQLNHMELECKNGINTGIKQGPINGKIYPEILRRKNDKIMAGSIEKTQKKYEKKMKNRSNGKRMRKTYQEKFSSLQYLKKSLGKSQNVFVESFSLASRYAPEVQPRNYFDLEVNIFYASPLSPLNYSESETGYKLSRDERLIKKRAQLRHRAEQFKGIQRYRTTERFRMRFGQTLRLLTHLDRTKEEISYKSCQFEECTKEAIWSTLHCSDHILFADKQQHLIRQCGFLYNHGEQCRMPVSDIILPVAVCNEHQNAPAHHFIDSAKPKKTTQISRKRINKAPVIRPVAKNAKNSKKKFTVVDTKLVIPPHRPTMIIHPHEIQQTMKVTHQPQKVDIASENYQFIHHNSGNLLASSQSSYGSVTSTSDEFYLKQDLMTICENSYESSEDTGVGGLSENELMSHDVIGSFDMESCAELTKVLSSLPTNTLDDLLTEPLQASRDDEEYLDRAIEEVSSVGMDQIAISAFDHLDGLDMLEMMDDDEQRQMLTAATNLISMSGMHGFLSSHDQDYTAMPSPMMS